MRLTLCAFVTFQEHISYLLTAIRASFGEKKLRAQEEPKSLPLDAFPGLQIYRNCFCGRGSAQDTAGEAYSAPQTDPIEPNLRGGEGEGKVAPLSQIPVSTPGRPKIVLDKLQCTEKVDHLMTL